MLRRSFRPPALLLALLLPFVTAACGTTMVPFNSTHASGHPTLTAQSCVPYARQVSGIQIYGDAYQWWDRAEPRYQRGRTPAPGSVLVLSRTRQMTHGHVAVVKRVVNPREIDVTQSNWGNNWRTRRVVYESQRVQDISPRNDWSSVRFWNYEKNVYGFPYAVRGFIYP